MNNSGNGNGDGGGGEIVCLRHLDAQLTEIAKFIYTMIGTEFESALRSFFASPPNETADGGVSEVSICHSLRAGGLEMFHWSRRSRGIP